MKLKLYYNCIFCRKRFDRNSSGRIFPSFGVCNNCLSSISFTKYGGFEGRSYVDYVMAPLYYTKPVREALAAYKFLRVYLFSQFFADCIIRYIDTNGGIEGADVIVPVPLSEKRFAIRGFNQSKIVAKIISDYYNIPFADKCLIKIKDTPRQSKLNKAHRITNVYGAFKVIDSLPVKNKTVVLIDDIFTTGSTMNACAKELKENGAEKVIGLSCSITDDREYR